MESATHPRVIAGRLAPPLITRVCVNSTKPLKAGPRTTRLESCPTRTILHDSVDSCVTNHRIVREHAANCSAAPGTRLLARGRGRPDGPAPRPESNVGMIRWVAPTTQRTPQVPGAAPTPQDLGRLHSADSRTAARWYEPSRGAGVPAAIPGCGMVPMWPSRVRKCSLAATPAG